MTKRRSSRSPKATSRTTETKPTKPKRVRRRTVDEDAIAELYGWGEIVDTAYGFISFPIRENQTWVDARSRVEFKQWLWLHFADRFPGGVIAGVDNGARLEYFMRQFAAKPAEALYVEPVSDAKDADWFAESERERSDGALVVRSAVAIQDFLGQFLDLATLAATNAAMLIGMSEVANRPDNPAPGTWWSVYADIAQVRPVTDAERNEVVKAFTDGMRSLLRNCLFNDGAAIGTVGRKPEESRDHRAYCMRERLVHSPTSIYARLTQQERFRRAKRDVLTHIILRKTDDTCSDSNWTRIMGNGKSVHRRVAPDAPYCEHL